MLSNRESPSSDNSWQWFPMSSRQPLYIPVMRSGSRMANKEVVPLVINLGRHVIRATQDEVVVPTAPTPHPVLVVLYEEQVSVNAEYVPLFDMQMYSRIHKR